MPTRFDEFWCWVPRKVAKKATRIEYAKAVRDGATEDEIIAGGQRWWHASIGKDPKYIVHPRRWVKEGRWEDEPDQVVRPPEDVVWKHKASAIKIMAGTHKYPRLEVEECHRRGLLTREQMEAAL